MGRTRIIPFLSLFFLAALLLSSCGTARKARQAVAAPTREVSKRDGETLARIDQLLDFASDYIGTRYRYGGNSPRDGFDCSGFACFVFSEFGVQLPRVSADMSKAGRYVGKNELQKGDLVFFATGSSRRVNHVGIVIETRPEVLMIHSSSSKGIRVDDINSDYYRKRYITSRRVNMDH
ncbi:MAG TPA: C40 family peptidase [Anseongella sp.]